MRKYSKRTLAAATVGAVAVSGVALAYWTSGGSGTGTAATGDVLPVTVTQTSTISGLAPGLAAVTLSGNFDNPNAGPVHVSGVTATVSSVTLAAGAVGSCDATDYTVGGTAPVNAEVASGTAKGAWTGLTLAFNNKATNQDGCKGATVTLTYAAS